MSGAAWLEQRSEDRAAGEDTFLDSFTGTSRTWVANAEYKWTSSPRRQLKLQAEYLRRTEDGTFPFDPAETAEISNYRNTQSGWFVQSAYHFAPRSPVRCCSRGPSASGPQCMRR